LSSDSSIIGTSNQLDNTLMRRAVRRLTAILIMLLLVFCFFASSVCIAVILSAFLAIFAEPMVRTLEKLRIPRSLGAGLIVLVGVAAIGILIYGSYGKLRDFSDDFPRYVSRIADAISPISAKIQRVRDSAGTLAHETSPKKVPEVRIRESSWAGYFVRGVGSVWGAIIVAAVVPFLTYFMLVARNKLYLSFKAVFAKQFDPDLFLDRLNGIVRSYVAGNLVIGAAMSAISALVFWRLGLPTPFVLGVISGMLNLIPFLGILIALLVPLIAGVLQFHTAGPFVVISCTVVALHLIAQNVLIPRFVGSRLDIGAIPATLGLLFWGWLWGVPGILLAVPLTAFIKLAADMNPSLATLSNLLARDPREFVFRRSRKARSDPRPTADVCEQG
jgi:predicted PurR-regulated permease PerM